MDTTKEFGRVATPPPSAKGESQNDDRSYQDDLEKQSVHDNAPSDTVVGEQPIKDPNIVDWDGPDDPANPMNWSLKKKVTAIGIVSILTFLSPFGSTVTSPASADIMATFHSTNETLEIFVTSSYLLGYVFGPLVLAPLSELYGRAIVYNVCNFFFVIWSIACALANNLSALIVFRLFAGLAGSAALILGAGTIADMVPLEKRGLAMMGWILGPVLGPTLGPLVAGYIARAKGWRWIFWLVSILAGAIFLVSLLFLHESYAYAILERKTKRLRKESGNSSLRSALDSGKDPKELFKTAIVRPLKMLFLSPIVLLLSLYMATIYGYQYLMFTTFPRVFKGQYGFSDTSVGLVYLGIGAGFLVALVFSGMTSDRLVKYLTKRNGGTAKPEYRLPLLFVGAIIAPIGLFLYGWTAEKKVHWIVPIIGSAFLGAATFNIMMPSLGYLVDAYTVYAASATAAATVTRSLLGALLPLAGNRMYDALGVGWGTSLLGFIAVAFAPVPLIFWKYGERIRNSGLSQVKF
ncbi:MFS general substrate transporter [Rhizodiscina lignyota]|uniref:MFS general substrate transporter n=1 Tax=Rhizodiscina lignyota TaxID=1504668 RepID=A0A9P4I6B3_9PEZI|nr:MFS general substrate transporter [Rhizodiscina lignyota]